MYGLYMTRITTAGYGSFLFNLCIFNLLMTAVITAIFKTPGYIAIFITSSLVLSLLELRMIRVGMRTSTMSVYGKLTTPAVDSFVKGTAEGPGLCVPALLAADLIYRGQLFAGVLIPCLLLFFSSLYWAALERRALDRLGPGESPIFNRRWMNKPETMFYVCMIDLIVGIVICWGLPPDQKYHVTLFIVMFFVVLQVFFAVHSYYGVRRIEKYDPESKEYSRAPGRLSRWSYLYDSIFEMALLNTPYYLIPYGLGLIGLPAAG